MNDTHPHAAAIDRIGRLRVQSHYNMTRQGIWKWRRFGVPKPMHKSLTLLAQLHGVSARELDE